MNEEKVKYYIESGLLERYALDQLDEVHTAHINFLLGVSLELGEALELILIRLEQQSESKT